MCCIRFSCRCLHVDCCSSSPQSSWARAGRTAHLIYSGGEAGWATWHDMTVRWIIDQCGGVVVPHTLLCWNIPRFFFLFFLAGGCFIINLMAGMFLSEEPIVFAGCIHIGVAFYRTPPSYDWFFCSFPFLIALKVVESLTACIISNPAPVCFHRNHEVVRATLSSCVCV